MLLSTNKERWIYFFTLLMELISAENYKIPKAKLDLLPQGFRVSIPDEAGVKNVAFNINRNRDFKGFEPGEFSIQISTPKNNRWEYENTKRNLQKDDIIYIWTNVQHNQLIYRSIEDPIDVEKLLVASGNRIDSTKEGSTNEQAINSESNALDKNNIDGNYSIDIRKDDGSDCEATITQLQHKSRVCKHELLFEENFENGLIADVWQYEVRVALDVGDAEFVLYDTDENNVKVANGMLTIVPSLWNDDKPGTDIKQGTLDLGLRCTSRQNLPQECRRQPEGLAYDFLPPIKSARINTRNLFGFKFGRVDVRARVPNGDWLFPLILLEPTKNVFGPVSHELAQIRIAFARGNDNMQDKNGVRVDGRTLYAGAVLYSESSIGKHYFVNVRRNSHFSNDFHIYTLVWTNNKLSFQVDAQEYGFVDGNLLGNDSTYLKQFDQEFYITLGVAAGGHGDFPDGSISNNRRKPWVNTSPKAAFDFWRDRSHWKATWRKPELEVDFVRVYAI